MTLSSETWASTPSTDAAPYGTQCLREPGVAAPIGFAMRYGASIRRCLVLLGLAAFACTQPAWGEALPEYRLKAAFLYNFAAFTDWPPEVGPTLNLCILGQDPFGVEIDALNGKLVGARGVAVQRKAGIESLKGCQVVFITSASITQLPRVLEAVHGMAVLTVADSPGAAQAGVILNMGLEQNRISFKANLGAARDARIILSSKLLRLATEVFQ
ncbi:MAG: putative transrane protein [Massilia sp.]|nr:putative transrane protein [Massilia sp.]